MAEVGQFRCLRCGHEYKASFTPNVPEERACPACGSNSVRRIKEKDKKRAERD